METRYLQRTSGGSYLISLPKKWVTENGLRKGSQLGLVRLDVETLMIDSNPMARPKARTIELEMNEDVGRGLTASYLSGYDRILIKARDTITMAQKERIKISASRLTGLEVINETSDSLLLANLVVPLELSVGDVMRRMHQIGSSMLGDAILALVRGDGSLAENVIERDDALDRLYFLIIRLLRSAVKDLKTAEAMGVKPTQCLDLRFAASMMEKIGDKSVDLCSISISGRTGAPERALELADQMRELYELATRALLLGDFKLSNEVTRSRKRIGDLISELGKDPTLASDALGILEDFADHIFDIADVVTER